MVKNFRNQQKIKDEQINFLLGDLEKNLEQYREALENKEKQLSEAKRILIAANQSFDRVAQENRDLKVYIEQIKQQFQQQNQKQQLEFLKQQKSFYNNNRPKKYWKVILEEESETKNEQESVEKQNFETEEVEKEPQVKKPKRKNNKSSNVFEYINQNAKRHKRQKHFGRYPKSDKWYKTLYRNKQDHI